MPATENQKVIEQLPRAVPIQRSAYAFARGLRKGVRMIFTPWPMKTSSKLLVNLESRSRNRKRAVRSRSWSFQARLRAGCVTQSPAG